MRNPRPLFPLTIVLCTLLLSFACKHEGSRPEEPAEGAEKQEEARPSTPEEPPRSDKQKSRAEQQDESKKKEPKSKDPDEDDWTAQAKKVELPGTDAPSHLKLARLARWSGHYGTAANHAKEGLKLARQDPKLSNDRFVWELSRALKQDLKVLEARKLLTILVRSDSHAYRSLGHLGLAEIDLDENLTGSAREHLKQATLPDNDPTAAQDSMAPRRSTALAKLYLLDGEGETAWSTMRDNLKQLREQHGPQHSALAPFLMDAGAIRLVMGDVEQARELLGEALVIQDEAFPKGHPLTGQIINQLALATMSTGDLNEAERLFQRAVAQIEKIQGKSHPALSNPLGNLGELYRVQEEYEVAGEYLARAVEIDQKAFGNKHYRVAASLSNLAFLLESIGDIEQAEVLHKTVIDIQREALGENHPSLAASFNNLAGLYLTLGQSTKARDLFKQAVDLLEKAAGPEHISTATAGLGLAQAYQQTGEYELSRTHFVRSIQTYADAFGEKSPQVAAALLALGRMEEEAGNPERSAELTDQATEILSGM